MTQSQKNAEHRREIWSDTITSWKQSGLSQRAYCEQHQLALGTFTYWRGRLKKLEAGNHAHKPRFLPVTLQQRSDHSLTLLINGRHHLEIKSDFDPDLLSKVVQAVQQVA